MNTRSRVTRLALAITIVGGAACSSGEGSTARDAARDGGTAARSGTARMADTLAFLVRQSRARPMDNPFLNRERAASIGALLVYQSGSRALNDRHRMADELLRAGKSREAIAMLEAVMRDAGMSLDTAAHIEPTKKQLFDLLAIAWLRLGEQENCLDNPAANKCILPLAGAARHARPEGARGAIARYSQLLRDYPDDRGSQYLLNVAWLAVGGYPDSVPRRWRIPGLAPRAGDPFPLFPNIAANVGVATEGVAGGVSIDDFNGDGLLDLFTTQWGIDDSPHFYVADGKGGYTDRTAEAGLKGITGGLNAVQADYDNDGDLDVLVARGAWTGEAGRFPNSLLRNRGDGTFEDVTFAAGMGTFHPVQAAAWADFDLDGWVDLFLGNENNGSASHPSELYHNNGDGTFTDVAAGVGIALDAFVKGATWGDVNGDGLPDLYTSVFNAPNRLYVNRGGTGIADWRFEERAESAGVAKPIASFPTWFWDYDNDGHDDLLVLSYDLQAPLQDAYARELLHLPLVSMVDGEAHPVEQSKLYRNRGDGTFEDMSRRAGLEGRAIFAMGSNYGDLDNDGWLDFYAGTGNPDLRSVVPNRMFRGVDGRRFEEVTLPGGFGHIQKGHAAAFADLDRDGDQDVFMVIGGAYQGDRFTSALFENPGTAGAAGTAGNAFIALELQGTSANRSAIGARVEVDAVDAKGATRTIRRTVGSGGSFGAGSLLLHVGLGQATAVREVRVRWPDRARTRTTYANLAVGRTYHVTQGVAPVALDRPAVPFRRTPAGAMPAHDHK